MRTRARVRTALCLTLLFIASAQARDDGWVTYKSDDGRFAARMPARAESKTEKVPDYGGFLDVRSLSAKDDAIADAVYYHDIARTVTPGERDGFLKKQCNGTARSHNGAFGPLIRPQKKFRGYQHGRDRNVCRPDS